MNAITKMEKAMTPQETLEKGTKVINEVEDGLRWLLAQVPAMEAGGVDRDCREKTLLHLAKALDFTKRGHKCIEVGVEAAPSLRGPGRDKDNG